VIVISKLEIISVSTTTKTQGIDRKRTNESKTNRRKRGKERDTPIKPSRFREKNKDNKPAVTQHEEKGHNKS
jgi:hypothetical protein